MVFEPPEPVLAKLTTTTLAGNHRVRVVRKDAGIGARLPTYRLTTRKSAIIAAWWRRIRLAFEAGLYPAIKSATAALRKAASAGLALGLPAR